MDKQLQFLYTAIADAQEIIKFIDNKTAFIIGILGAFFLSIFGALEDLIAYSSRYSLLFWILVGVFIILITTCVIITKQIIRPTNNPEDNIISRDVATPSLRYFITPNNYNCENFLKNFKNRSSYKLTIPYKDFLSSISSANEADILNSLSYELLKVSYVRNIKNDRFNYLVNVLIVTTCFFLFVVVLFFLERQDIRVLTKRTG